MQLCDGRRRNRTAARATGSRHQRVTRSHQLDPIEERGRLAPRCPGRRHGKPEANIGAQALKRMAHSADRARRGAREPNRDMHEFVTTARDRRTPEGERRHVTEQLPLDQPRLVSPAPVQDGYQREIDPENAVVGVGDVAGPRPAFGDAPVRRITRGDRTPAERRWEWARGSHPPSIAWRSAAQAGNRSPVDSCLVAAHCEGNDGFARIVGGWGGRAHRTTKAPDQRTGGGPSIGISLRPSAYSITSWN